MRRMRNLSVTYVIEVPRETEISSAVLSGAQTIQDVRGPVKAEARLRLHPRQQYRARNADSSLSGSIRADSIGDDLRANSASGTVTVSNIKGGRPHQRAFRVHANHQTGRNELKPRPASGSVSVEGATSDVKAHAASGRVNVQGNPGTSSYWDLKTASGTVQLGVPSNANFHLAADAISGEIRTDIPVVVEEQGKHSLRARVGTGGCRIEVHTVSGEIHLRAS